MVAVCGKNDILRAQLEATEFENVQVQVCGFVKQMSDYMEVADVLVTKAGPGTIAEAAIRGLPTMLSSYLPGQEAGNVPFVVQSGFGEYSGKPKVIARTVRGWIQDPDKLKQLQTAAPPRDAGDRRLRSTYSHLRSRAAPRPWQPRNPLRRRRPTGAGASGDLSWHARLPDGLKIPA